MAERTPLYDVAAAAGAEFAEEAGWLMPARYGAVAAEYHQARAQAALFDVSHRGNIELTGPEAQRFLHNLCTNDVLNLAPGSSCEAFFTTAKARVIAPFVVYRLPVQAGEDSFWLDVPPGLADRVVQHLDHHLISEQLEFADRTRDFAQLHLAGPQAEGILHEILGEVPGPRKVLLLPHQHSVMQVRRHEPLGLPGYDLLAPPERAVELWQRLLETGVHPAGLEVYDVLRLEAGTPRYGLDMDDNRLVVEVGRIAQAICYTKGCYLGQEPIVMARDRGHVNRTLLGLTVQGADAVPAGAKVLREGEEVGQVTSSVVSPRLGTIALAYLRRGHQEPGTAVTVETATGQRSAAVTSLPFSG